MSTASPTTDPPLAVGDIVEVISPGAFCGDRGTLVEFNFFGYVYVDFGPRHGTEHFVVPFKQEEICAFHPPLPVAGLSTWCGWCIRGKRRFGSNELHMCGGRVCIFEYRK